MSDSFYTTRKDKDLASGSEHFSAMISAGATEYGLTTGQATSYAALNSTFNTALAISTAPNTRTKGNVAAKNDARRALKDMAANLCNIIINTPTVTTQQKLDLGVNVRATPSPRPAPGAPFGFKLSLETTGTLTFTWKCKNPKGAQSTTYNVFRRTTATGEYTFVGSTGEKKFVDATIPAGTASITYQVQAIRSTGAGPWAQYNVNFGAGGVTSAVEETPMKVAA